MTELGQNGNLLGHTIQVGQSYLTSYLAFILIVDIDNHFILT